VYIDVKDTLCGIPLSSLSTEHLGYLDFKVLVDLVESDDRIHSIIAERMHKESLNDVSHISASGIDFRKYQDVVLSYNKYFRENEDSSVNNYRAKSYLFSWSLLDDDNRKQEVRRFLDGERSVLYKNSVDYSLIEELFPERIEEVAQDIINRIKRKELSRYDGLCPVRRFVATCSKKYIESVCEILYDFPSKGKGLSNIRRLKALTLTNQNIPEKYIVLGLRALVESNSSYYRTTKIKAPITIKHLEELPTIMRLNVLSLLGADYFIPIGVNDISDISKLCFGAVMRKRIEVQRIVGLYEKVLKKRDCDE